MRIEDLINDKYYYFERIKEGIDIFITKWKVAHICINTSFYHNEFYYGWSDENQTSKFINIREATLHEIQWINLCIKDNKYRECPELLKPEIINQYEIY